MAEIVLGMALSHGPMLSTPPDDWGLRVAADRQNRHPYRGQTLSFDELVRERQSEHLDKQITRAVWHRRHTECRQAIDTLARVFEAAKPDVAVIFGNDQHEIFADDNSPAISVFWGQTIVNNEFDMDHIANLPPGVAIAIPGHIPPGGGCYPGAPDLGRHIIESAMADEFDIASLTRMSGDHTPHAFGFIFRQVMHDKVIPTVPVMLNTFFPPNQPSVHRCYALGQSVVKAIRSWKSDARVALFASGGLSHFVIDEQIDRAMLDALRSRDLTKVAALDEATFQSGTSELKNWIALAGAMAQCELTYNEIAYVPCYRSEAGTGTANAFATWTPPAR